MYSNVYSWHKWTSANVDFSFEPILMYFRMKGKDIWGLPHWHNLHEVCQPYAIDYDYIVRTETFHEDAAYIINHILRGRSANIKDKVSRKINYSSHYGRSLTEYKDVDASLLRKIIGIYFVDMKLYGYNVTVEQGGLVTRCEINTPDRTCC